MNVDIDYKTFCSTYYEEAAKVADMTVAGYVKKYGQMNRYVDVELVKDLGVSYGLEKVYSTYDVDHESGAHLKTYLSTVVRNSVLTELGKEMTAVGAKKRNTMPDMMFEMGSEGGKRKNRFDGFRDYMESGRKFEKKEDLISQMLQCLKRLKPNDQVIVTCWMLYPKRDYTDKAIEELGLENNKRNRNMVNVRCVRAIETLGCMMAGAKANYRDITVSSLEKAPGISPVRNIDPNSDYNLRRRRKRAAVKSITGGIDFKALSQVLTSSLPD